MLLVFEVFGILLWVIFIIFLRQFQQWVRLFFRCYCFFFLLLLLCYVVFSHIYYAAVVAGLLCAVNNNNFKRSNILNPVYAIPRRNSKKSWEGRLGPLKAHQGIGNRHTGFVTGFLEEVRGEPVSCTFGD